MVEEQQFRATKDFRSIAFGAVDGTTHTLEADEGGVISAKNDEDAAYLEMLGLRHVRADKPKPAEPAPAAAEAGKEG